MFIPCIHNNGVKISRRTKQVHMAARMSVIYMKAQGTQKVRNVSHNPKVPAMKTKWRYSRTGMLSTPEKNEGRPCVSRSTNAYPYTIGQGKL
jgi:hypothetical protein